MLADIDNECEGLGCNRTDFIREAVQEKLDGETHDQEENSSRPDRNTTPKEEPKATIELIPEPKITIKDIPEPKQIDNSNNPPYQMTYFNGKLLPFAKRYNIDSGR